MSNSIETPSDAPKHTILLREDSATVALHVRTLLQHMGHEVRVIADAAKADAVDGCDLAVIGVRAAHAEAVARRCGAAMIPIIALSPSSVGLPGASATISVPVRAVELRDIAARLLEPPKLLDRDVLATIWGGQDDPRFLNIVKVFAAELVVLGDRVKAALAAGDMAELELQAHALKGAASQIGTSKIRAAAGRLEGRVREIHKGQADATGLPALVDSLDATIAPGVAALEALLV